MAILKCCCWKSVRRGSFASGIFTLIFYVIVLIVGAFQFKEVGQTIVVFVLTTLIIIFSALCVLTSVLLLIGLCVDNRLMLLPWIVTVPMTTLLEVTLALYLISDSALDAILGILFAFDFMMCGLNVYCLLCVISQYQDYLVGRGRAGGDNGNQAPPSVRFMSNVPPTQHSFSQTVSKASSNGAPSASLSVATTTSSSTTTTKSFHPTDLSSITEEPSSYEPSDIICEDNEASQMTLPKRVVQIVPTSIVKIDETVKKSMKEKKTNEETKSRRSSTTHLLETEVAQNYDAQTTQ